MQPFTVYSFRVIAVNKLGHSQPSKESYYFVTLREAPTGKPVTTIAHNTSATSVYISWKAPPPESILGEFLGYRITYRPRDYHTDDVKEIYIRDSAVEVRNDKIRFARARVAGASRASVRVLVPSGGLRDEQWMRLRR
uniref:Fibronectin type-III domain-containing protein n=1 Tax=Anopheles maculatus TaxID=74869 RepID=A0A182T576_9DIPT